MADLLDQLVDGDDVAPADGDFYTEPEYNISEVRVALRRVLDQMAEQHQQQQQEAAEPEASEAALSAAYRAVLLTLARIAGNVLRTPVSPAHLSINLRNPAVQRKFGQLPGARDFLAFCGFRETGGRAPDEPHTLSMSPEEVESYRVRIERAVVILNAVAGEHAPPPTEEELDQPAASASTSASASAPASIFLANGDEDTVMEARSPEPADENMKADLEPTYNIGDVRTALRLLFTEVDAATPPLGASPADDASAAAAASASSSAPASALDLAMHALTVREAYCQVLDTLCKITQNLLKTPVNPQHLRINLGNPAVRKKFAQFEGAVRYLHFLGFALPTIEDLLAAPATPTSAAGGEQQLLVLPESSLAASNVKLTRALSILTKHRSETAPTAEENERRALGSISRDLRVFDMTLCLGDPSRTLNVQLGAPDEVVDDSEKGDKALIIQANAAERRRVHEMARTDVIVTKARLAELKEATKRKYHKTLVKITFTDKKAATPLQQGSGRFSAKRTHGGYVLGSKSPAAAGATAMELDNGEEEEEKSGLPLASPVPALSSSSQAASPTAAAAAAASPAPSPAPAPEIMLSAYFRPWETLGDLFAFVRSHMAPGAQAEAFYLHLPPSTRFQCGGEDKQEKHAALLGRSLQSLGLVPAASMFFHFYPSAACEGGVKSVIDSLKPEVLASKTGYDIATLAALMPTAVNVAEIEAAKAREIAEQRERERASNPAPAVRAKDGNGSDDDDIEAYMRRKKATAAAKSSLSARSGGNALGGSSSSSSASASAASAAAKRVIPGLFKPK